VSRADSFFRRLVGLLGRKQLGEDEGLWIEPCDSVHTLFMRFPIDVAFVDRSGVVVRKLDRLPPWRATRIHHRARACVELAAGVLQKYGVVEGSRLALVAAGSPNVLGTEGSAGAGLR
jgi:uncharacterized membrane protein (UPF0127 family)